MLRRLHRRWSTAVVAACVVGACAVIVFSAVSPAELPPVGAPSHGDRVADTQAGVADADNANIGTALPPLSELQQLCARPLRQPLFDPPPAVNATPTVAAQSAPPPTARLVGLVYEPGRSVAFFQKSSGAIELCSEGERFKDGGAELLVTQIEQSKVTVSYANRVVELKVPVRPEGRP